MGCVVTRLPRNMRGGGRGVARGNDAHVATSFEERDRIGAEEGVTSDFLSSDDAFEEEGVLGAFGESFEGGDGGEAVAEEAAIDRDGVGVPRLCREFLEVGLKSEHTRMLRIAGARVNAEADGVGTEVRDNPVEAEQIAVGKRFFRDRRRTVSLPTFCIE